MKLFFTYFTPFMPFMLFSFMTPQQTPFRAGVDLVEVDVIVTDKNGEPVTGLIAADFEIRERGQPQRIDTIFLVTDDSALGSRAVPVGPILLRRLPPHLCLDGPSNLASSCSSSTCRICRRRGSTAPGRGPRLPRGWPPADRSGRHRRQRPDARKPDRQRQEDAARSPERCRTSEPDPLQRHAHMAAGPDRRGGRSDRPSRRKGTRAGALPARARNGPATAPGTAGSRSKPRSRARVRSSRAKRRATAGSRSTRS